MKHDRTFFAATGIPSLFLIFSVLCLAVLSLLTLGKSRDELQAANFAIQQTALYYKTCETATGTVTAIQKQLASDYSQVSDPDAYFSLAGQIPDEIDGLAYDSSANVIPLESVCRFPRIHRRHGSVSGRGDLPCL
mgnify:CR=1 FL=1